MVKRSKRVIKENAILDAAEKVFGKHGFTNSKMDMVGKEAGMSKASVYFYFESKENLYMALVFRGLNLLNDLMYACIHENQRNTGLDSVLSIMNTYFDFSQKYPFYTEAMLDYMALVRVTSSGNNQNKTTNALNESLYFKKIHHIHNIPVSLVVNEIKRGIEDGSIRNQRKPEMQYLTAWAMVLGYLKLTNLAGKRQTLHTVDIHEWRTYLFNILKNGLINE